MLSFEILSEYITNKYLIMSIIQYIYPNFLVNKLEGLRISAMYLSVKFPYTTYS